MKSGPVTKSEFERLERETRDRITNFNASDRLPREVLHDRAAERAGFALCSRRLDPLQKKGN
jgi:hypothetical protein